METDAGIVMFPNVALGSEVWFEVLFDVDTGLLSFVAETVIEGSLTVMEGSEVDKIVDGSRTSDEERCCKDV